MASLVENMAAEWVASTSYSVGNCVMHNNKLYECIQDTSSATFDDTNDWKLAYLVDFMTGKGNSDLAIKKLDDIKTNSYYDGAIYELLGRKIVALKLKASSIPDMTKVDILPSEYTQTKECFIRFTGKSNGSTDIISLRITDGTNIQTGANSISGNITFSETYFINIY